MYMWIHLHGHWYQYNNLHDHMGMIVWALVRIVYDSIAYAAHVFRNNYTYIYIFLITVKLCTYIDNIYTYKHHQLKWDEHWLQPVLT